MKQSREKSGAMRRVIVFGSIVIFLALIAGAVIGFSQLRDIWLEQSAVNDYGSQVTINAGRMVKADVIAECLGLKPGANLALIDFADKRRKILERIPNLRDVRIVRTLPDKVTITAEEREPMVRLSVRGRKTDTGKVADIEGVVFLCQRGTRSLPVIREVAAPGTGVGKRLGNRASAALTLIRTCREQPQFSDFNILEIDISKHDYLTVTLGGEYNIVKLAWEGMDDPSPVSQANLVTQLTRLLKAMRSRVGEGARVWNATDTSTPGRIYADTKNNLTK